MPFSDAGGLPPRYTILGGGRWAGVMAGILSRMGREAAIVSGVRREPGEAADAYRGRLRARLDTAGDIVWIAVPPGPHVVEMARAVLLEGRNLVIEKPWLGSALDSAALADLADRSGLRAAVHYQYCFLDTLRALSSARARGRDAVLSGRFTISRASLNGIAPGPNLGSHLLAVWRCLFPDAALGAIEVGYEREERRAISLSGPLGCDEVDFTSNAEPIVQRFVAAFEAAAPGPVPLGLAAEIGERAQCL